MSILTCPNACVDTQLNLIERQERQDPKRAERCGTGVFCLFTFHNFGGATVQEKLLTVTGRPMTIGTGLRLPIVTYQAAVARSQSENVKLNHLLSRLIAEGLDKQESEGHDHD